MLITNYADWKSKDAVILTRSTSCEKSKSLGSEGSMVARLDLKEEHHQALLNSPIGLSRAQGTIASSRLKFEAITDLCCPWMFWVARATLTGSASSSPWSRGLGNLAKSR